MGAAAGLCVPSSLPVDYIFNTAKNVSLQQDKFYYFYSDFNMLGEKLRVIVRPTSASVNLYSGKGLLCPDQSDVVVSNIVQGKVGSYDISLSNDLGLQIFGVKATADTSAVISVAGENPNNADLGQWRVLTGLFLALVILLLVMLFVHAILARGRVHYQVDPGE
jgi:hypothetical protein